MKSILVTFPGGKKVDAAFDGFVVHTDQSREHDGDGSAPEPFALFLASLATCAGLYALAFCRARSLSTDGLRLTQHNTFDAHGQLQRVHMTITLPRDFPARLTGAICTAVGACKVKKALGTPPELLVDTALAGARAHEDDGRTA
ncbi:OsmC family protein [Pendulispora brunnea]|uniref:OsmC family protein n=1 Tax=Pendulispora brunnea TaxID=2905690 RepID=A0ABZ2K5Y4_9BACT